MDLIGTPNDGTSIPISLPYYDRGTGVPSLGGYAVLMNGQTQHAGPQGRKNLERLRHDQDYLYQ